MSTTTTAPEEDDEPPPEGDEKNGCWEADTKADERRGRERLQWESDE